jgi:ABC-type antimicrobial peptide transport system permease subunit
VNWADPVQKAGALGAIRMVAKAELRRFWRGTVVVMLLVGLVGAVTLAALSGARRSSSSLRRFNDASRSSNIEFEVKSYTPAQRAALARAPGVEGIGIVDLLFLGPAVPTLEHLQIAAAVDRALGTQVDRPRLVAGRLANPDSIDEIDIGEGLAAKAHLRIGDSINTISMSIKGLQRALHGGAFSFDGPRVTLHIVGLIRRPLDLASAGSAGGVVLLTPAFNRAYRGIVANPAGYTIRVRAADVPRTNAAVAAIFHNDPTFQSQSLESESAGARDAINVITDALLIFAAVAALAGVVAIAIVLNREVASTKLDQPVLLALGTTRLQRTSMSGGRALVIAIGGAVIAVGGAIAASPLLPFGVARRADPDPGVHADWRVLAPGVLGVVAVVFAIAAVAALRSTRIAVRRRSAARPALGSRVAGALTGSGLSPAASMGLHMATDPGSGDRAVPLRSAAFGVAFGVVGLSLLTVFASSLGHLSSTPRLYGWTFDFKAETTDIQRCNNADDGVAQLPGVASLGVACYENMQFAGRPTIGWALVDVKGTLRPEIVTGRLPQTPNEVALGATTMRALGKRIGDTVRTAGPQGHPIVERVVGEAVFPQIADAQPLAEGVWFTSAGWYAAGATNDQFSRFLVGTYSAHAERAAIARAIDAKKGTVPVSGPAVPTEIDRLRQISWFPKATAALLAVLALVAVAHAVATSTRRRRRDLAVLKTIGFGRPQVRHTVAWQATAFAVGGLIVGIPLGVFAGEIVWRAMAHSLGVRAVFALPLGLALLVPGAILAVNAIAFFPARRAARQWPAAALRSE